MTGTQRMTELEVHTVVRLSEGLSKTPRLKFAWGAPVEPISVGLRGAWAILGDGMLDVHLHLGFDGKQLLLAPASPSAPVLVNGRPVVAHGWCVVPGSSQIEFAGVVLRVEHEGPALELGLTQAQGMDAGAPLSKIDTMFDGGILRERARALSDATPAPRPQLAGAEPLGDARTMLSAEAPTGLVQPAVPSPAEAPTEDRLRKRLVLGPGTPQVRAAGSGQRRPSEPPTALPSDPPISMPTEPPTPAKAGFWASASVPKKISVALLPLAVLATLYSMDEAEAPPAAPVVAAVTPSASVETGTATATTLVPRLARTPASPDATSTPGASDATGAESAEPAPSAAPEAAPPAAAAPPASASATSAAVPAPSASAVAAATQPAPQAEAALNAVPGVSPRAALDSAFLGNFKDASRAYAKLAAANPDNHAFQLAAQLTSSEAVRRP